MADISDEAIENRAALAEIKRLYCHNEITREQAKVLAAPIIKRINKKSREIANKYGDKNYMIIDFVSVMRSRY